jgi:hypothetical protein
VIMVLKTLWEEEHTNLSEINPHPMELVITILEVGVKMAYNNLLSMRELHSK